MSGAGPRSDDPNVALEILAGLLGIGAVLVAQFAWVKPTNFGGFDEWFILSRVARGIVDHPLANRPLALLWSLPAAFGPASLWTYYALHSAYLAGVGGLTFLICRRSIPGNPGVAFLAGVFAATWAPLDYLRLNVIMASAGQTFGAYLAVLLLVLAWHRQKPLLLTLGSLAAFVSVRGYEAGTGVLVAAPVLLVAAGRPARAWTWLLAWESVVLFAASLAALPLLLPSRTVLYQKQLLGGVDLDPGRVAVRLADQYAQHLLPIFTTPFAELLAPVVPVSLALFVVAFALATARPTAEAMPPRLGYLRLMVLGLVLAGSGYLVFALTASMTQTGRTQFFSAPGIGLFLAPLLAWTASLAPRRFFRPLLCLLGAWVVAVGAGRTTALQGFWDKISVHADQARLLGSLVEMAPRLEPNTFVVLIDEAAVFETTFGFRHALEYLYPGEAVGFVWGKWDIGYPARLTPGGIVSEPWPQLRAYDPVTFHRFEEVVVVHQPKRGPLRLLEEWPASVLPSLPPGARYAPRTRILQGSLPRERRILGAAASLP